MPAQLRSHDDSNERTADSIESPALVGGIADPGLSSDLMVTGCRLAGARGLDRRIERHFNFENGHRINPARGELGIKGNPQHSDRGFKSEARCDIMAVLHYRFNQR